MLLTRNRLIVRTGNNGMVSVQTRLRAQMICAILESDKLLMNSGIGIWWKIFAPYFNHVFSFGIFSLAVVEWCMILTFRRHEYMDHQKSFCSQETGIYKIYFDFFVETKTKHSSQNKLNDEFSLRSSPTFNIIYKDNNLGRTDSPIYVQCDQ